MPIEYLGLDRINGPLVVLEGCRDAFYEEIVEFVVEGNKKKLGKIIELYEDKAIIQVFDTTDNMGLSNTHTRLIGASNGNFSLSRHPREDIKRPWEAYRRTGTHCVGRKTQCQRTTPESGPQGVSAKFYMHRDFGN